MKKIVIVLLILFIALAGCLDEPSSSSKRSSKDSSYESTGDPYEDLEQCIYACYDDYRTISAQADACEAPPSEYFEKCESRYATPVSESWSFGKACEEECYRVYDITPQERFYHQQNN